GVVQNGRLAALRGWHRCQCADGDAGEPACGPYGAENNVDHDRDRVRGRLVWHVVRRWVDRLLLCLRGVAGAGAWGAADQRNAVDSVVVRRAAWSRRGDYGARLRGVQRGSAASVAVPDYERRLARGVYRVGRDDLDSGAARCDLPGT